MKPIVLRLHFANCMRLCKTPWEGFTCSLKAESGEPEFSCRRKVCFIRYLLSDTWTSWFFLTRLASCHPFTLVAMSLFLMKFALFVLFESSRICRPPSISAAGVGRAVRGTPGRRAVVTSREWRWRRRPRALAVSRLSGHSAGVGPRAAGGWTEPAVRGPRARAPGLCWHPGSWPRPQRRSGQCQWQQGHLAAGAARMPAEDPARLFPRAVAGRRLAAGPEVRSLPSWTLSPRPQSEPPRPGARTARAATPRGASMCVRPRVTAPARLRRPPPARPSRVGRPGPSGASGRLSPDTPASSPPGSARKAKPRPTLVSSLVHFYIPRPRDDKTLQMF